MRAERRYSDEEIAAIFKQATEAQEAAQGHLAHHEGLTLDELQEIGHEVGITPAFIARAAAALDQTPASLTPDTFLSFPISVGRTVELPGPLTEVGWDQLVADLRETFHATGQIRQDGSLRQWKNGNLQALVEPTATGHRLRLRTLKGNAKGIVGMGLLFIAMSVVFLLMLAVDGRFGLNADTLLLSMFGVAGLAGLGVTAFQLPRWAEQRGRQMEAIAVRAVERASTPEATPLPAPEAAPEATPEATPRLDLDLGTRPSAAANPPGRTRRRT